MQSRLESLIEQALNVGSGMALAMVVGHWLYPAFGYPITATDNFWLTCIFTVISVTRGYIWRRHFNKRLERRLHAFRHTQA